MGLIGGDGSPSGWWVRLAAGAPVPVFVVAGCGGRLPAAELLAEDGVSLVPSPREANVLLVAGPVPAGLLRPLLRVHDQMSRPRLTVLWSPPPASRAEVTEPADDGFGPVLRLLPDALRLDGVGGRSDLVAALRRAHGEVLRGERASEELAGPDVPPAPWRGVGPHGQGGEGMMGGRPYGRPLPERGPDRDGLELDRLRLRVGPFFPAFPPGLTLYPTIQGDVVQALEVGENPFEGTAVAEDVFVQALGEPVPLAELETARARSHLTWLAGALGVHGLAARSRRAARIAARIRPDLPPEALSALAGEVRALRKGLRRWRALRPATRGVGTLPRGSVGAGWGPVGRASGLETDARAEDPAYRGLGFRAVTGEDGDAAARWEQRVEEVLQSLTLAAAAAGDEVPRSPGPPVEGPRGRIEPGAGDGPCGFPASALPDLLTGLEWGDAVTTIVSLDLDLEGAAVHRRGGVEHEPGVGEHGRGGGPRDAGGGG